MMAGVTWILTVLCAAGCHLASASPVHSSTLVVPVGHNVSLLCNMTHRDEITWYLLRSEQLQPLLTVKEGRFGGTTDHHTNNHRMKCDGTLQTGLVSLEIQEVEEEDAGLYFCIGRFADKMHVNRGIQLTVDGGAGRSSTDRMKQPCLSLGLCLLPALLAFCVVCMAGCYLWSGVFHVSCNASSAQPCHVCQAQFIGGQSSGGIVALLLGAALPSGGGQELQHSAHKTVHTESAGNEQTYQQRAVMERLHS
ncbi:uncharacterized protein LOC102306791 isoform X3 [Haplochromis burtoni]|uniref:uncharacterized protein LOC102306791 isoform X3 n=1 Tax=Haplochromis burtoni TaxID=8153 RepID=UPI001C2DB7EA|nr:uncharacterized protein LOC102306791 isoform X3 [Haplochromis burtoni]